LDIGIAYLQRALEVFSQYAPTLAWARLQTNLGLAYWRRTTGARADNVERAHACFSACLRFYTRSQHPVDWAMTHMNLGATYLNRRRGKHPGNIEQAIRCLDSALTIFSPETFPREWARNEHDLAQAYCLRQQGNRADNVERAIAFAKSALSVRTVEAEARDWASTTILLATAFQERIKGNVGENIAQAIEFLTAVLSILDRKESPLAWAQTHANLASAYHQWSYGRRSQNLEEALTHLRIALEVLTRDTFPNEWGQATSNLGNILLERTSGERALNIEEAISCYRAALGVLTYEQASVDWAAIQVSLGSAYLDRIEGDRGENLEKAITCSEQALRVCTRTAAPVDWAGIQTNLGRAYAYRAYLTEAREFLPALACFEAALEIWTLPEFPQHHRDLKLNVAVLLLDAAAAQTMAEHENSPARSTSAQWQSLCAQAHRAFADARRAQTELGWFEYDALGRASVQGASPNTRDMYAADAWCLVQLGDIKQAVIVLETGRAVALAETEAIAGVQMTALCQRHAPAFAEVRAAWDAARKNLNVVDLTADRSRVRIARESFLRTREAIRHCADCKQSDFLPDTPSYESISAATPSDMALIYVAASPHGGMALVVPPAHDTRAVSDPSWREPFAILLPALDCAQSLSWLLQIDSDGRPTQGYYLALERRGMQQIEHSIARPSDGLTASPLRYLTLAQFSTEIPSHLETLQTAVGAVVAELRMQGDVSPKGAASMGLRLTTKTAETAWVDLPLATWLDETGLRNELGRRLDWCYQHAELDVLLPKLRAALIEPLHRGLVNQELGDATQRIGLIPCGRLGVFPLHAVPVGRDNVPFGETCELSYQASARSLAAMHHAAEHLSHRGPVVAIGNPLTVTEAAPLPSAEREAVAVATLARRQGFSTSRHVVGAAATRSRVLTEIARLRTDRLGGWLHLAGHGHANFYNPDDSYLLLSGLDSQGYPERLSLAMLQRERLLDGIWGVSASGCVTGLGDIERAPDELSSLAGGLLQAGALTVLASLWSVKDHATSLLMTRFHQLRLEEPHGHPANALRHAAHWLRTATRSELDRFAQNANLPTLAAVDPAREPLRGLSASASAVLMQRAESAGEHIRKTEAPHLHSIRLGSARGALDHLEAGTSKHPASLELPYADPIYWAAFFLYGL
jgi:CHAT domain-containing protein/tetratricopeptide (TPR) repeat protein